MGLSLSKRTIVFFLLLNLFIPPQFSFAGREPENNDKYPKFTKVFEYLGSVYFLGCWANRYVVAEYDKNEKWHIYSSVGSKEIMSQAYIIDSINRCVFIGAPSQMFNMVTKSWEIISSESNQSLWESLHKQEDEENYISRYLNNDIKNKLPLPSYNAILRWRYLPFHVTGVDAKVGANVEIDNVQWFAVDFYDGEGYSGLGGLGIYDWGKEKFGIVRDSLLVSSSCGLLANAGDTIFVATNFDGEYGPYGDHGLILVDIKKGTIAQIPPYKKPLDGNYFSAIKLINNKLWITTDRSIVYWDLKSNIWKSITVENVITSRNCFIYRRPIKYSPFKSGNYPTNIIYDSTIVFHPLKKDVLLEYLWPLNGFAEVKSQTEITGWISKERYEQISKGSGYDSFFYFYFSEVLYSDSTLEIPYHSFLFRGPIRFKSETARAVEVGVNEEWVNMNDIEPTLTESLLGTTPQLRWRTIPNYKDDIQQLAFNTIAKEEEEKKMKIPILDTILTIVDTMDLFDRFQNILDARWLPTNDFKNEQGVYPKGIELNRLVALWVKNNKLECDGKIVAIDDSISKNEDDALYTFKILGYTLAALPQNRLVSLKLRYTIVMIPQKIESE